MTFCIFMSLQRTMQRYWCGSLQKPSCTVHYIYLCMTDFQVWNPSSYLSTVQPCTFKKSLLMESKASASEIQMYIQFLTLIEKSTWTRWTQIQPWQQPVHPEHIMGHNTLQEPAFQLVLLLWDSDNYIHWNNNADHFPFGLYSEETGKYCMYFCM